MRSTLGTSLPVPRFFRYTWPLWLFLAIFGLGVLYIAYDQLSPQAIQMQAALEAELRAIPPVPGGQLREVHASRHRARALASATYRAELASPAIRAYYDTVLGQRGWQFTNERTVKVQGTDAEERLVTYCRADWTLVLQYGDGTARYGWTYSLGVSWGLHRCPR